MTAVAAPAAAQASEIAHSTLASPIALVVIGAAAFTLPIVARRLRLPAVVLEILFGVVVGPQVLGLIGAPADQDAIELLAELGLLLLMFLAGFEVDFERVERHGIGSILFAGAVFGAIVVASWLGTALLQLGTKQHVFLALLVSASSVGIVVPALRATSRSTTRLGQVILITAILAEFLSLVAIVVYGALVDQGVGLQLLAVPALFLIMATVLALMRRAAWWYPERFERLFSSDDPDELGIRASLALMLVFVGVSLALGVEAILGAFLAGATFAFLFRETGMLETRLGGFAFGFFIPIFFINVGLTFPLRDLGDPTVILQAVILIVVAVVVKLIPAQLLLLQRFTIREATAAGVLLAGQLSVIIALADLGLALGLLSEGLRAGTILLVAVTAILSPVLFRALAPPLEPAVPAPPVGEARVVTPRTARG